MGIVDWIIVILAGAFFGVMVIALAGFVIRIFREAKPNRRHR